MKSVLIVLELCCCCCKENSEGKVSLLAALGFISGGLGLELSCAALYVEDMVGLGILRLDLYASSV